MEQKEKKQWIFLGAAAIGLLLTYAALMVTRGTFVDQLTYSESIFADFWSHIDRLMRGGNIYGADADAVFPPLAYLFLKIFACPLQYKANAGQNAAEISITGFGILTIAMYLLLFGYLFCIAVRMLSRDHAKERVSTMVSGVLLFSYAVWGFAFERGNLTMYAMLFLMFGMALRNSSSRVLRELSLLCVAISAGFKLYPALFGFLWLAERRYKEAVRLVIYGLLMFLLPFLFVGGFSDYLQTFQLYLDKRIYSHASVWGLVMNHFPGMAESHKRFLCEGIVLLIVLWALFALFTDGVNWKTITLLTATQTVIIPEQYVYTYVFIAIPLVLFLDENVKSQWEYIYAVLFAALFTLPPVVSRGGRGRQMCFIWVVILILVSIDEIYTLAARRRSRYSKNRPTGQWSEPNTFV